jgi:hypothetical protein
LTTLTFDKLVYVDRLKAAGFAEPQARAMAMASIRRCAKKLPPRVMSAKRSIFSGWNSGTNSACQRRSVGDDESQQDRRPQMACFADHRTDGFPHFIEAARPLASCTASRSHPAGIFLQSAVFLESAISPNWS